MKDITVGNIRVLQTGPVVEIFERGIRVTSLAIGRDGEICFEPVWARQEAAGAFCNALLRKLGLNSWQFYQVIEHAKHLELASEESLISYMQEVARGDYSRVLIGIGPKARRQIADALASEVNKLEWTTLADKRRRDGK